MEKKVLVWHAKEQNVLTKEDVKKCGQKKMVIGGQYCRIKDEAFKNNIRICSVVLEPDIKEIGKSSFCSCTSLRHVELGSVRVIEKSAFYNCARLQKAEIPKTTVQVGARAFALCKRLKEVKFDTRCRCREIQKEAFAGCICMETAVLPGGIIKIADRAFYRRMSLKQIIFPEGTKKIGTEAFYQCGLTDIQLPSALEEIGDSAFLKCKELEYVKIPEDVKVIGKWAFHGCCKLKVLEIGHDPEYIGEWIINRSAKIRCRKGSKVEAYCIASGLEIECLEKN